MLRRPVTDRAQPRPKLVRRLVCQVFDFPYFPQFEAGSNPVAPTILIFSSNMICCQNDRRAVLLNKKHKGIPYRDNGFNYTESGVLPIEAVEVFP